MNENRSKNGVRRGTCVACGKRVGVYPGGAGLRAHKCLGGVIWSGTRPVEYGCDRFDRKDGACIEGAACSCLPQLESEGG